MNTILADKPSTATSTIPPRITTPNGISTPIITSLDTTTTSTTVSGMCNEYMLQLT